MISIADNGGGIPEHVKPHIFEPYFTTKRVGEGKGLGLAMCHGIVSQSGGSIQFTSEAGRGTTFKIYLPRLESGEEEEAPEAEPHDLHGSGSILLVEADDALRNMAAAVLGQEGYAIYPAADGDDAIVLAGRVPKLDLLVADAAMPGMKGKELARVLCAMHPSMKVLFASPDDSERAVEQGLLYPHANFLTKPYPPLLLIRKVRIALDGDVAGE